MSVQVVLATHNAHKVEELRRILGDELAGIELIGYDGPEPIEDGATFAENALIKARAAAAHTGLAAIADDSGITVAALGGAPGIHSARYAGTRNDTDNLQLVLTNLAGVEDRTAAFVCAAAFVSAPGGAGAGAGASAGAESVELVEVGTWPGSVLLEPVGPGGFGYDPIFKPDGLSVSAAELRPDEKNAISHRALAFGRLIAAVRQHIS